MMYESPEMSVAWTKDRGVWPLSLAVLFLFFVLTDKSLNFSGPLVSQL